MGKAGLRIAILVSMVLSAACSSAPDAPPPAPSPVAKAPQAPAAPPAPAPVADRCGAAEVQHLVGRPRSEIPVPVRPERVRVACTGCPITMDFNPERLNFFFDAATGRIREIRCG